MEDPMKGKQGVWSAWTATCTICKDSSPEKGHLNCYWKHRNDDLDTARGIVYGFALVALIVLIGLIIYSFIK